MFVPSTRTSGSAMPRFSSSSRIRSRMTIEVVAAGARRRRQDDRDAALQVEPEGRRVAEAEVEREQDDGDADAAEQRRPQAATDHSSAFDSAVGRRRRGGVGVGLATSVGVLRPASACWPDGARPSVAGAEPLVSTLPWRQPRSTRICTSSSISSQTDVVLEPGDEAVDARRWSSPRRRRPATDCSACCSRMPPPLRPDQQEVHRHRDEQEEPERDEAAAAADVVIGRDDRGRASGSVVSFGIEVTARGPAGNAYRASGRAGQSAASSPDRQHLGPQRGEACRRRSPARHAAISCSVQATLCRLTQPRRGRLADCEQVPEVAAAVAGAHRAAARRRRAGSSSSAWRAALTCSLAGAGQRRAVAAEAGLQDAVELVDAEGDRLDQRRRVADAHQVARAVGGQVGERGGERRQHLGARSRRPTGRRCRSRRSRARRSRWRSRPAATRRCRPARCRTAPGRRGGGRRGPAPPTPRCARRPARRRRAGSAAAGTRRAPSGCRRRAAPGRATAISGVSRCVEPS